MSNTSEMYQRGFDNASTAFSYIPDFKTKQEKLDFENGLKAGYDRVQTSCPACGKQAMVSKSLMNPGEKCLTLDIYCDNCGTFYNLKLIPGTKNECNVKMRKFNSSFQKDVTK